MPEPGDRHTYKRHRLCYTEDHIFSRHYVWRCERCGEQRRKKSHFKDKCNANDPQ